MFIKLIVKILASSLKIVYYSVVLAIAHVIYSFVPTVTVNKPSLINTSC